MAEFERELGLKLSESFRLLYRWHNGQPAGCSQALEKNRMFMSLEDMLTTKRLLDGMIGQDFNKPGWWRLDWLPFLHNGAGDYLCLDFSVAVGRIPPRLLAFWHDWERRNVEHPSVTVWLRQLVSSMLDGSYEVH